MALWLAFTSGTQRLITGAFSWAAICLDRHQFGHGASVTLPKSDAGRAAINPSRQNTNTGKLTAAMMDDVFGGVRRVLGAVHSS
jgi:hypothetical protein